MGEPVDGDKWKRCDATLKDDSGQIKLVLWDQEIQQVNEGDEIEIVNGYIKDFKGTLQLQAGKYGEIKVTRPTKLLEPTKLDGKPFLETLADALEYQSKILLEMAQDCRKKTQ